MDEAAAVACGALEWSRPWFSPWRERGDRVARLAAAGLPLHEALNRAGAAPVRFVPAAALPAGKPYEQYIFEQGACPTRANRHDFFNGLCWIVMPLSKRRLNELQAAEIANAGIGAARGPVRDAVTIFDENGAVLAAPAPLWESLLARDWRRLFVELRPLWGQARLLVFGHALLDQLAQPRKNLTAHLWAAAAPAGTLADVDRWLAQQLTAPRLAAKPFTPLPLMGIPGWCAGNENFSFYDDSLVFRAARGKELKAAARATASRP